MPDKTFTNGATLPATDLNDYLMEQVVVTCLSSGRPTAIEGRVISETDTDNIMRYDGTSWRKLATVGATIEIGTNFTAAATHVLQVGNATSSQRGIGINADNTATRNQMTFHNPNGAVGTISTNGTTTSYNTTSDARLKDDRGPLAGALDLMRRVVVRRFTWRKDGTDGVGVFAQELHEVIPEAVTVGGDNPTVDPWQVDYAKLVPHLIASVQELAARVEELERG